MKSTPLNAYLRKVQRRPARSESYLQQELVRWCRKGWGASVVQDRFAAIPNGWGITSAAAKDRAIHGARLKAEGCRPGMPDLVFWRAPGLLLWLEMKLGTGGRLSASQEAVHASLRDNGHWVEVARDLAQAMRVVLNFYGRDVK